jgi:hypothetical protein
MSDLLITQQGISDFRPLSSPTLWLKRRGAALQAFENALLPANLNGPLRICLAAGWLWPPPAFFGCITSGRRAAFKLLRFPGPRISVPLFHTSTNLAQVFTVRI